jgi:hypothetical protein
MIRSKRRVSKEDPNVKETLMYPTNQARLERGPSLVMPSIIGGARGAVLG